MSDVTKTKLPAAVDNGFDAAGRNEDRVIRGVILKCVDGNWTDADGAKVPAGTKLLAWAMTQALQLWRNKLPVETIIKQSGVPLPDVDELNRNIPQAQWEMGLSGPRPPWAKQHIVYLLNAKDGSEFTFISSTTGAAIAAERLRDRVKAMRMLRGEQVVPVVELGNKSMPTKFGTNKLRPDFTIVEWAHLGPPATAPALSHEIGTKVEAPTLAEELNDSIPDFDTATARATAKSKC
jgi:hypothetical protein